MLNKSLAMPSFVTDTQALVKFMMGKKVINNNKMLISKYETERSTPNMENLGKLARALDVTVDYMVFDNVPRNARVEFKDLELLEVFKAAEILAEEDRKTIKTIVDAILVKRKVEGVVKQHH